MDNDKIVRGNLVLPDGIMQDGCLVIKNGVIRDITDARNVSPTEDYTGHFIAPGFIDLHIHGIHGLDTMDGSLESIQGMAKSVLRHGVTSFLPTTVTESIENTTRAIEAVRQAMQSSSLESDGGKMAHVLGLHLEGPFISRQAKGAQNEAFILPLEDELVRSVLDAGKDIVRIITIAPELAGAGEVIELLKSRGIAVSVGHTAAEYEVADAAMEAGCKRVTHCFNAMTGLHHRKPGVVGAALLRDDVMTELIADGIHVHPAVMKLLYKIKGQRRIMLVTDAIAAADMPEGNNYVLGGQSVSVKDGKATLADGTIAGSVLTMDVAVQNMVFVCGVPIHEAVAMASSSPAESIGVRERKGAIEVGLDADLVVLDSGLRPVATLLSNR